MRDSMGDQQLDYEIRGDGPDVLFMHGLGADRRQAEHCLGGVEGFRVITLNLPGHGDSGLSTGRPVSEQVGFRTYARAAAGLLSDLGVATAFVGGISMGAGVAVSMAIMHPELVRGLVLVRPAWVNTAARPQLDLVADIGAWIADAGEATARSRLIADRRFAQISSSVPLCANGLIDTIARPHVLAAPDVLPLMVDDCPYRSDRDLEKCTMPALVVSGDHDPLHPRWIADDLASVLPNATSRIVPARYTQPERHQHDVTEAIGSFLDRVVERPLNPELVTNGGPT